jgi:predicted kinase
MFRLLQSEEALQTRPYHRPVTAPLLVVVTGMPSSGKTTIAESLAVRLQLPLVAKDDLKESLFETLGAGDIAWSGRLGDAAYDLMFTLARTMLRAHVPLIVEANFFSGQATRFITLPAHRVVQIYCDAPLPVLLERYAARERHPGHNDNRKIKELPARHASGAHAPLDVPGETIRLDTSAPVDLAALADRLRALL